MFFYALSVNNCCLRLLLFCVLFAPNRVKCCGLETSESSRTLTRKVIVYNTHTQTHTLQFSFFVCLFVFKFWKILCVWVFFHVQKQQNLQMVTNQMKKKKASAVSLSLFHALRQASGICTASCVCQIYTESWHWSSDKMVPNVTDLTNWFSGLCSVERIRNCRQNCSFTQL